MIIRNSSFQKNYLILLYNVYIQINIEISDFHK